MERMCAVDVPADESIRMPLMGSKKFDTIASTASNNSRPLI